MKLVNLLIQILLLMVESNFIKAQQVNLIELINILEYILIICYIFVYKIV